MYLKSIEAAGFKSFASKIRFEFKNGITAIVGPNGSGKSNVADAVRWVLGEQSAKQLRGSKMEDVIFSGTENRKPLGTAYVSILFDNSDKTLPIDYEEVKVSRRVYRSGESEYSINNVNCRLKDIQALFFDTGIGKEGYSIIGQGQIDKILSDKPDDRRELFDEAVGIVKYKQNKITTEKSLVEEQLNLSRVNDILSELEYQLEPLKEQKKVAHKFLDLKDKLKNLDINVYLREFNANMSVFEESQENLQKTIQELNSKIISLENIKKEYNDVNNILEELNNKITDLNKIISNLKINKEKTDGKIKLLFEQQNIFETTNQSINKQLKNINITIDSKTDEANNFSNKYVNVKKEKEKIILEKKKYEENQNNINNISKELNKKIENNNSNIINNINNISNIKEKISRYNTLLEEIEKRKVELNKNLISIISEKEILKEDIKNSIIDLKNISNQYDFISNKIIENNKNSSELKYLLNIKIKEANDNKHKLLNVSSKLETIKNISERYEGYNNCIKSIMQLKNKGVLGVVADIFKTKKEYETALETALGGSIQNVITDTEDTAKNLIRHLKEKKLGRATFLPITNISAPLEKFPKDIKSEKGVIGIAYEVVDTQEKYKEISKYLLGRILLIDNIDNALSLSKKYKNSFRMVTLDGEFLNIGGSIAGGTYKNNSNFLGRKREIEELSLRKQELIQKGIEIDSNISILTEKDKLFIQELEDLNNKKQEISIKKNTLELNNKNLNSNQNLLDEKEKLINREKLEIEKQIKSINDNKKELLNQQNILLNDKELSENNSKELEIKLNNYSVKLTKLSDRISEFNLKLATITQQEIHLKEDFKRIENDIKLLKLDNVSLKNKMNENSAKLTKLSKDIIELQNQNTSYNDSINEKEIVFKRYEQEKENFSIKQINLFNLRDDLANQINKLDKDKLKIQTQIEKLRENQETLNNYITSEYNLSYDELLKYNDETLTDNINVLKKDLLILKTKIKSLGSVDISSIDRYEEINNRYKFLLNQRDDILQAENNLKTIILELDEKMRIQFKEKFEQICKKFDEIFKELFGGGETKLLLDEQEDILKSGIKIIVQPPGKKLQNMMQLSGGEKALTAISLLFAIQSLRPSPFCLLDEIEAALDDANVVRYAEYLHKLTDNTQFIVITHRRGTMVLADTLYGITMQEKGISTLVSVELVEKDLKN